MKSRFCVDQAFERLLMDVKGAVTGQYVRVISREATPSAVANIKTLKNYFLGFKIKTC